MSFAHLIFHLAPPVKALNSLCNWLLMKFVPHLLQCSSKICNTKQLQ